MTASQAGLAKAKREVAARSDGRCEAKLSRCERWASEYHHRKKRSAGGKHTTENLLHVCAACHRDLEANPARSFDAGLLVHSWDDPAEIPVRPGLGEGAVR